MSATIDGFMTAWGRMADACIRAGDGALKGLRTARLTFYREQRMGMLQNADDGNGFWFRIEGDDFDADVKSIEFTFDALLKTASLGLDADDLAEACADLVKDAYFRLCGHLIAAGHDRVVPEMVKVASAADCVTLTGQAPDGTEIAVKVALPPALWDSVQLVRKTPA